MDMSVHYQELPFYTIKDSFDNHNKKIRYKRLTRDFSQEQISTLQKFHLGSFRLSGTNHLMPEFIITEATKKHLFYPQGFCIMEADASYYTDRSGLDSYELRYTLSGRGVLEYRGQTYVMNAGTGFWIDCREPHRYYSDHSDWICTIFHINGTMAAALFHQYSSDGNVLFSANSCPNFEMLQFQVLKSSQKIMPYYEYKLSCLIDILLTELLTSKESSFQSDSENEIIPDIISYIQDHYTEDLTLEQLMHRFGISRSSLCAGFKKYTGFTIKKYILTLRFHHAKRLLHNSILSIEAVAEQSGFHDTAHFVQMFKKNVGMTPLQYRKQI